MKFTQIPSDTFKNIQINAGILMDSFVPAAQTVGKILGATGGGVNFTATPSFIDMGDGIDNAPKNTKELIKLDSWEAKMSGTFVSVTAESVRQILGAADIASEDATHIVPREDLEQGDFSDIWWVGDYSDKNEGSNAGYIAIHLMNALSTGGFQIQSTDRSKGQFAFEFTGYYSMSDPDTVPFEIYVKQ